MVSRCKDWKCSAAVESRGGVSPDKISYRHNSRGSFTPTARELGLLGGDERRVPEIKKAAEAATLF